MAGIDQKQLLSKLARGESLQGVEIGDVDFTRYCFKKEVDFSGAIFIEKVVFDETQFLNGANFRWSKFSSVGGANFNGAKFSGNGEANFRGVKFSGKGGANFQSAEFSGNGGANFFNATFSGADGENFQWAEFSGEGGANFYGVEFSGVGGADFDWAKFSSADGVDFSTAVFSGEGGADFWRATFSGEGRMDFVDTVFDENCSINFKDVRTKNPKKLRFENVFLGRTLFYGTDIEEFSFKNVKFGRTKRRFINRELLADDIQDDHIPEKKQKINYNNDHYSHVEILYRQLKRNFEEQRDYARAGDFHYGEMEMRRKQEMLEREKQFTMIPSLKYFSLTSLYKLFSGYGEKWYQALISFFVVVFLFSVLNLFWIEPERGKLHPDSIGNTTSCSESYKICPGVTWPDSLLYSFKVMTLQRDFDFKVKRKLWWGRAAVAVQFLIGPTIIALMILAIRRQFRR